MKPALTRRTVMSDIDAIDAELVELATLIASQNP